MRFAQTHSQRLERWLGPDGIAPIVSGMRPWYGPPIAVAGVPGGVFVTKGGEFVGPIVGGGFASLTDFVAERLAREGAVARKKLDAYYRDNRVERFNSGFGSLAEVLAAFGGRNNVRTFIFNKTQTIGAFSVKSASSFNYVGVNPPLSTASAAAPGGTAHTSADAGAAKAQTTAAAPPVTGQTGHLAGGRILVGTTCPVLLYDRLWSFSKTMNSTALESTTGVPTRYQNTTLGAVDSAEGNFLFPEITTSLPATAHNWDGLYLDQGGASGTLPTQAGVGGAAASRIDLVTTWFMRLADTDYGIASLSSITCSALVATGAITFGIGHPLAIYPAPLANVPWVFNGITSGLQLVRVFNDAHLAMMCLQATSTATPTIHAAINVAYN